MGSRTERYLAVSDVLLDQTALAIAQQQTPASLKTLSEVMKNIRDIQMLRSGQDRKEQQARIDKLRKEADREVFAGEKITVVLEGTEGFAE